MERIIANLSSADSIHDFGEYSSRHYGSLFNASIPSNSTATWDEPKCLNTVMNTEDYKDLLKTAKEVTVNNVKFTITQLNLETSNGAKIGETLGTNSALVVDFNQHGFLSRLKQGLSKPDIKLYYVMTREVVNDPAPKTPVTDNLFTKKEGITLEAVLETGTEPITYPFGFNPGKGRPTEKFFSNYTLSISPIRRQKSTFGTTEQAQTDLTVTNQTGTQVRTIKNSKKENAIASILSLFKNFLTGTKTAPALKQFNVGSGWAQKRSGDWLQALCCLQLKQRTFDKQLPEKCLPYFVSHDQIAVAYALQMGVSVVFIGVNKTECYVLKNSELDVEAKQAIIATCTAEVAKYSRPNLKKFLENLKIFIDGRIKVYTDQSNKAYTAISPKDFVGSLKPYFRSLLHLAHYYTLPTGNGLATAIDSKDVCIQHKAILDTIALWQFHSRKTAYDGDNNVFNSFASFESQFEKTELFKSVDSIDFKTSFRAKVMGKKDTYIFLPYIATIPNDSVKKVVAAPSTLSRSEFPKFNAFLEEQKLHLSTERIPLSKEDFALETIIKLNNGGDFDDEVVDDITSGGRRGGWVSGAKITNMIEVYGNKQVTHPLFTALISEGETVSKDIEQELEGELKGGVSQTMTLSPTQSPTQSPAQSPQTVPFSPFLPLFIVAEGLMACIPQIQGYPDKEVYSKYVRFIELLKSSPGLDHKHASAFRDVFITTANADGGIDRIAAVLGVTVDEYLEYSLITSALSDYVCGRFLNPPPPLYLEDDSIKTLLSSSWANAMTSPFSDPIPRIEALHKELSTLLAGPTVSLSPEQVREQRIKKLSKGGGKTYRRKTYRRKRRSNKTRKE